MILVLLIGVVSLVLVSLGLATVAAAIGQNDRAPEALAPSDTRSFAPLSR